MRVLGVVAPPMQRATFVCGRLAAFAPSVLRSIIQQYFVMYALTSVLDARTMSAARTSAFSPSVVPVELLTGKRPPNMVNAYIPACFAFEAHVSL